MPDYVLDLKVPNAIGRSNVRRQVVEAFLDEEPGEGTGDSASKYLYRVSSLRHEWNVVIQRPAMRKNGFDFRIWVPNYQFPEPRSRDRDAPRHSEIEADLLDKQSESREAYRRYFGHLEAVYRCEEEAGSYEWDDSFTTGLPASTVSEIMKWMFIEQDIRYWNYAGRKKPWGFVPKP